MLRAGGSRSSGSIMAMVMEPAVQSVPFTVQPAVPFAVLMSAAMWPLGRMFTSE